MEYPFILGTAGHIDHGKTRLIRAMTGVDCDRLREEKKRGITIELGFAPLLLPSGRTVSVVDVPGHERFIRHMVAGASGIDAVLFVVAADEGIMPQTREHLDILRLLGVENGLVALTKLDLADAEMEALVREEVTALTRGTFLENAPVFSVSAETGQGLDALTAEIDALIGRVRTRARTGAFFMPVDRVFRMKGFGSVVTGTVYRGALTEGEDVEIVPSLLQTKVRSIQVHGEEAQQAAAGQRTAVNLASLSLEQLKRGDVVCAKGRYAPTDCLDVLLELLPGAKEPLTHWQRVRLHIGTADVVARLALLDFPAGGLAQIESGARAYAQLMPETPLAVVAGERFVVRFYSPLVTIGGGKVLRPYGSRPRDAADRRRKAAQLTALAEDWGDAAYLRAAVAEAGFIGEPALFALSQMTRDGFDDAGKRLSERDIVSFGAAHANFMSPEKLADVENCIAAMLTRYHREHPELAGLDLDELYSGALPVFGGAKPDMRDFRELLALLEKRGKVASARAGEEVRYRCADFRPQGDARLLALAADIRAEAEAAGFELPDISELPRRLNAKPPEIRRALDYLKENEGFRIAGDAFVLTPETARRAFEIVANVPGDVTVAAVRDAMHTSRKYALAILEFFDARGATKRVGDKRIVIRAAK